jgi:hypothetical protein
MRRAQLSLTGLGCVVLASIAVLTMYRPVSRTALLGENAAVADNSVEADLERLGEASRVGEDAMRDIGAGFFNEFLTGAAHPSFAPRHHKTASLSKASTVPVKKATLQSQAARVQRSKTAPATEHDVAAKAAAKDVGDYFERIPIARVHKLKLPAAKAKEDAEEFFNRMPAHNVNSFHEASNAVHSAKYGNDKAAARSLDTYFNGLTSSEHLSRGATYRADRAADDMGSYFDRLPTKEPASAFHEEDSMRPVGSTSRAQLRVLPANRAEKDLEGYFDSLPTASVNAMHDRTGPTHLAATSAKFSAHAAKEALDSYFSEIPVHKVNAFHQSAAQLAAEGAGMHSSLASSASSEATEAPEAASEGNPLAKAAAAVAEAFTGGAKEARETPRADPRGEWQQGPDGARPAGVSDAELLAAAQAQFRAREQRSRAQEVAGLSESDMIEDADAPTLPEEERHAHGYDTQYGATADLVDREEEKTPAGPVTLSLNKATDEERVQAAGQPMGAIAAAAFAAVKLDADAPLAAKRVRQADEVPRPNAARARARGNLLLPNGGRPRAEAAGALPPGALVERRAGGLSAMAAASKRDVQATKEKEIQQARLREARREAMLARARGKTRARRQQPQGSCTQMCQTDKMCLKACDAVAARRAAHASAARGSGLMGLRAVGAPLAATRGGAAAARRQAPAGRTVLPRRAQSSKVPAHHEQLVLAHPGEDQHAEARKLRLQRAFRAGLCASIGADCE